MTTPKSKAVLAAIIGNSIFGLSFLASKIALLHTEPLLLLCLRFGIAFLLMNLLLLFRIVKVNFRGKNLLPLILLGICQPVLYFVFENYGIKLSTSSFSGIMIGLVPIAGFFMGSLFIKEPFSMKKLLWACCSVLGVCLISFSEKESGTTTGVGFLCLVLAVLTAALYNTLSKKAADEFTAFERTYIMFLTGFVLFVFISVVFYREQFVPELAEAFCTSEVLLPALYLAVFSSVIAFFCLNYAVTYLTVQQATSYTNLTSIVSFAAGVLLLHESFTWLHLIGVAVILLGIIRFNQCDITQ